jgi:hypothetical protein
MRIAYLLFVYTNPRLIARTIERLDGKDCAFFVHVDAKSKIDDFSGLRRRNVFFTRSRLPVHWAEFSGVEAIMLLMREAIETPEHFAYFVLLSGSEYPIHGQRYIHHFFESNKGVEFISMVKVPNSEAGKPLKRVNTIRIPSSRPILRQIIRGLAKLGLAQRDYRDYLGDMAVYAGNTWWALTRESVQYVLDFAGSKPHVAGFFRNTFAPEEMFFHTIIGNSPYAGVVRRNLVFEDWSEMGARPGTIGDKHLALFESRSQIIVEDAYGGGEVVFARKLSDSDLPVVESIDDLIQRRGEE